MAAFPDIVIDPYLVCLPRDCNTAEELDSFVENLLASIDVRPYGLAEIVGSR
jgi:hypothetical protein